MSVVLETRTLMTQHFTSQGRVQHKSWEAALRGQHIEFSDLDTVFTFHVCALRVSLLLALSLLMHVTHEAYLLALRLLCLR